MQSYLPAAGDDAEVETLLGSLFGADNLHFGNPVERFKSDVVGGRLSPESAAIRRLCWRAERRNYRARMKERAYTTLHDMLKARKK